MSNTQLNKPSQESRPIGEKSPHSTDPNRWADGTLRPMNKAARQHGGYESRQDSTSVQSLDAEVSALIADNGGPGNVSMVWRDLARRFVESDHITTRIFEFLRESPLTNSGRQKRALHVYLAAIDRQLRLAQLLGLERKFNPLEESKAFDAMFQDIGVGQLPARGRKASSRKSPGGA
ncbi:MAG: hypothetical protein U0Q11_11780 [Vicinamibacterales bacterium]